MLGISWYTVFQRIAINKYYDNTLFYCDHVYFSICDVWKLSEKNY